MDIFINNIISLLKDEIPLSVEEIEGLIEIPPDIKMGDYAFPCFAIAKQLRKDPKKVASKLSQELVPHDIIIRISAHGPYLNFYVSKNMLFKTVLKGVFSEGDFYGGSDLGKGKTVVIDYSSPNIAKHLAVHHLRSAVIGNAIYNLYKTLGYKCVGINHLGDWGTQFGQLIVAFKRWGSEFPARPSRSGGEIPSVEDYKKQRTAGETGLDISKLNELYVRFHKEVKSNNSLEDEARDWFRKLEKGSEEAREIWQYFKDISLEEFDRLY